MVPLAAQCPKGSTWGLALTLRLHLQCTIPPPFPRQIFLQVAEISSWVSHAIPSLAWCERAGMAVGQRLHKPALCSPALLLLIAKLICSLQREPGLSPIPSQRQEPKIEQQQPAAVATDKCPELQWPGPSSGPCMDTAGQLARNNCLTLGRDPIPGPGSSWGWG